jgi:ion channel
VIRSKIQSTLTGGEVDSHTLRRNFLLGLYFGLRVVWPILSALLLLIAALGFVVGRIEGWRLSESLYFSFITALSIGYGDLTPKLLITRLLAVVIGLFGLLFTALVAAVAVKALSAIKQDDE